MSEVTLKELQDRVNKLQTVTYSLKDVEEIKNVKWKFLFFADDAMRQHNAELWKEVIALFVPDKMKPKVVSSLHGEFNGVKELEDFFKKFTDDITFSLQFGHNPIVKVNGDMATGDFYMTSSLTMKEGNQAAWVAGKYNDVFQKIDGKWYIKEIKVNFYYWTPFEEGWANKQFMV